MVLLRAFASGAVALTGVEAIADGVPAFKKPESRNAARTLATMAVILGIGFFGLALLANRLNPTASEEETLLSILGSAVFGSGTLLYYILQFSTFAILILAANTAYADFPRLSSIIARDEYLPHQFKNRGDRLVFSNGIVVLAVMAVRLDRRVRRRDHRADPSVCRGRVHRLHPEPGRHGPLPAPRAGTGLADGAWS